MTTENSKKDSHRDLPVESIVSILVDAILSETYINRNALSVLIKSHVKAFVNLKNTPKDYNKLESPNLAAKRLRTIEKKEVEIKFWLELVRDLDPDNIEKYYKQLDARLVSRGFKSIDHV